MYNKNNGNNQKSPDTVSHMRFQNMTYITRSLKSRGLVLVTSVTTMSLQVIVDTHSYKDKIHSNKI